MTVDQGYDYIIIGGGTAGLTLAIRLTEDANVKVLVIEAGQDKRNDPFVLTPGLMAAMYGKPEYDWNFNSVPQPGLNNRRINNPRGKQLGGSSALNFLMLLYPSRSSLDAWQELGNEGWNYDTMAPYFRKFATVHGPSQAARDVVGLTYHDDSIIGDGPVQVSYSEGYGVTNSAWVEAFAKLGLGMTADARSGNALGAFQQPASIDPTTKTRSYAATAYYTPEICSRQNLTVMTETIVKKIIFDTNGSEPIAKGVLALSTKDGAESTINGGEVIVSAGAFMTPQILELSGVGSKTILDNFNIPVIIDNPAVGENLQDHPLTCQSFEVKPNIPSSDALRDPNVLNSLIEQFQASREGPLGQSNISVAYSPLADASGICSTEAKKALFAAHEEQAQTGDSPLLRSLLENSNEPTAEYILLPGQVNTTMSEPSNMAEYLVPSRPENYISILSFLNHPFSRGSVHISSTDVHQLPTWDPKFNSNPLDLEISARHAQFTEVIASTSPFSELLKSNGARIPEVKADSLENAKEVVRQGQVSCYHPSGSCAMRPRNKNGVVDTRLRVYGAKGLRVVDASVFPLVPTGNIQSVVYAVAEMAADLIKEDRKAKA